jgi:glyoxylase-like metal-dependent hydrolase (beta-lactamase superfamily II)
MRLQSFPSGPVLTNAYGVACLQTGLAGIVDPAPGSWDALARWLRGYQAVWIALTHSHWDHIGDLYRAQHALKVPVCVHCLDAYNVRSPGSDGVGTSYTVQATQVDLLLEEGHRLECGHLSFEVLHTPGHTPGSLCLYEAKEKTLLSGDTLFQGGHGRVDLPTANPAAMRTSLKRLAQLPVDTRIFPGHGASTTLGQEIWLQQYRDKKR